MFVDDFIALCQGTSNLTRTRNILLQAVNTIFCPLNYYDSIYRKDPVSIKKLHKGDCSWATIKNCLGWIINTQANTITLPEHRVADLASILADIPSTQKCISKKRWWSILGKFRSVSLALPGSHGLFSFMQHALTHSNMNHHIALCKDVHNALNDFRWLLHNITNRPTCIAEVVPLRDSALGYHNASWCVVSCLIPHIMSRHQSWSTSCLALQLAFIHHQQPSCQLHQPSWLYHQFHAKRLAHPTHLEWHMAAGTFRALVENGNGFLVNISVSTTCKYYSYFNLFYISKSQQNSWFTPVTPPLLYYCRKVRKQTTSHSRGVNRGTWREE